MVLVVREVGATCAQESWVAGNVEHVGRLAYRGLALFWGRAGTSHTHGATHELVEVNQTGCELDARRRALGKVPKHRHRVGSRGSRSLKGVAVHGVEAVGVDLAQVGYGGGHVGPWVVDGTLNG